MSRKKNDVFSEMIVGLFMLAVLSLLVYFTIIISGVDMLRGREKVLAKVTFTDVGGLKERDSIRYRGTKVGAVESIDLSSTNLTVTINIDRDVVLREGYRIAVCNLSLLGGNFLQLEEGDGAVLPLESTAFVGEPPTDWMRDIATVAKNLNSLTGSGGVHSVITNLEIATEKVRLIVDRVERGEGTVGKLLSSDDKAYNDLAAAASEAKIALSSVNVITTNANEIITRVRRGEGTVGRLLSNDSTIYNDIQNTMANASAISDRLARGEGLVGRLISSEDPLAGKVEESIVAFKKACDTFDAKATFESANQLLANLNEVSERLKSSESTFGRLTNSPELYNEVDGLVKDVRQIIDNYRDTTPITTFGSLIMGAL